MHIKCQKFEELSVHLWLITVSVAIFSAKKPTKTEKTDQGGRVCVGFWLPQHARTAGVEHLEISSRIIHIPREEFAEKPKLATLKCH